MRTRRSFAAFSMFLAVLGIGLLLLLSGCGSNPSVAVQSLTLADTPIPPAPEESYPEVAVADIVPPPPTPEPYVPPSPETQPPLPTAEPVPTATPRPTLEAGRVVHGWGNFPRLPVVAVAREDDTLALYLVQGDTATMLVGFDEYPYTYRVDAQLSPDGRYVACLTYAEDHSRAIELVDTQDPRRVVLYQSTLDTALPFDAKAPSYVDWPTSLAWLDERHLLYTVGKPGPCSFDSEAGPSCVVPGELWETDLNGGKQQLLAADRLALVLGASPDGQQVYFLRLGAEWVPAGPPERYNLYSLDLTSGVTTTLWPQGDSPDRFTDYMLLPFPDGSQRVLFRTLIPGDTVAVSPAVIWALEPRSGAAAPLWTATGGVESVGQMSSYGMPSKYFWSPRSEQDFVYLVGGGMVFDSWWVDLAAQQSHLLLSQDGEALAWTAEGIAVHERGNSPSVEILQLLDENGQVQGEIDLFP